MQYDFDEVIDRKDTNSLNYEGWKQYIFKTNREAEFPFKDDEYIRLWVADMDFSTPPEVLDAIRDRLDKKILGYTRIYDEHYYAVLENWFLKRYSWQIERSEIVTSPGIVSALFRLVSLLTEKEESVLIFTPSYAPFKRAGDYNSRRVIYSDLVEEEGVFHIDFADVRAKIADKENNIRLFILSHPHNPTGRVWTRHELEELGQICLENDVWIISDEVHCDLLRIGQAHIPLVTLFPNTDRIITCTAPSKTFNLAGNMLSHIFIKDEELRTRWRSLYEEYHSPLSIVATQAAYERCEDWLEQLRIYLDGNLSFLKEQLQALLPKARFSIPEATYLAWVDFSAYADSVGDKDFTQFFAEKAGVLVEGGGMFVANGEGFVRINVACPRAVLEEAIKRVVQAIHLGGG